MQLTKEELGQRIRVARESSGLTQEQLGEAIELSRMAINQIESGSRSVSSIELDRIAYSLGRDIKSFFVDNFVEQDALAALFRADSQLAGAADLRKALQKTLALGREMTNLERLLGIDRIQLRTAIYELSIAGSRWDAIQQGQRIAMEERQRLGLGLAPISDWVELCESQGVRTGFVRLPDNISGITLSDDKIGIFVVINESHNELRCRFSFAHEYAHVLIDRDRFGAISRTENRADLLEVRANAFAAEFMMPEEGVEQFVQALGKGGASRAQMAVFDGENVVQVEQRAAPGSQDIQLYDVVSLAHYFGVSRAAALYRLKNLRMISEPVFQQLKAREDSGAGKTIAGFLLLQDSENKSESLHKESREEFKHRFLGLALEAYRREEISRAKFIELAAMMEMNKSRVEKVLSAIGFE